MGKTLLQLTQNILSAMDSDEVNSIYDTVESIQVATIVVETAEAEFNNLDLPSLNRILQLESVSDVNYPNTMRFDDDVNLIGALRYRDNRNSDRYKTVEYLTPNDFFETQLLYSNSGPNTQAILDHSGVTYYIKTNKAPDFWTSVDNNILIFDSYDSDFENTLEATNSFALGSVNMNVGETMTDDFVFPIPNNLFPLLLAEAKATCFVTLKQMANPKSEQIARRQRSRMQHNIYKSGKANNAYARSKFNFARNR